MTNQTSFRFKKSLIILILLAILAIPVQSIIAQEHQEDQEHQAEKTEHVVTSHDEDGHSEATHEGEEEHGSDMSPLLFLVIALIIGALTRFLLEKSSIPYTVSLLVIGIVLGIFARIGYFDLYHIGGLSIDLNFLNSALNWAGKIDPHLILFVFLPTLIFEAAFAMDVHTFKKSFTNAFILAVPGIIIALFMTAFLVVFIQRSKLGLPTWSWQMALLFGAVVSATDPVAVVSILKEMGASKKLGTLIEGESLLNDGTAIVIFMVFFLAITGAGSETSPVVEFFRVAVGGSLVGIVIGYISIRWVKKVFNDALVEITVIVAAAYLTFYVAEHFLHVSGVLGLVALGLMFAGVGRTRISPEVEHFLHEFWELMAFIANTLIFIIVGVVIANRIVFTGKDFIILGILYVGIHIIRALIITAFYPLMKKIGYGLPKKNAYVLWWGALRGAVGLALALIVAGESKIDSTIRDQFLFLSAGIVTLTLVVNATTIKTLINLLGINKIAPSKALMIANAKNYLRQASENNIDKLKKDRFMSKADWNEVHDYLPEAAEEVESSTVAGSDLAETRRRILEKEKSSYWNQFRDGLLDPTAVKNLSEAINEIIDADGQIPLSERKDLEGLWQTSKLLNKTQTLPIIGKLTQRIFLDRLAQSYDTAKGFVEAQYDCLKLVEGMVLNTGEDKNMEDNLALVEEEINENRIHGLTFLRNLRNTYPEIYNAINTRQAIRSNLNYEKRTVERLLKKGQIGSGEASVMIESVEERMKMLIDTPPEVKPPEKTKLLESVQWLKELDKPTFTKIVNLFQHRMYAVGENIIKEKSAVDGLYVIARGNVKVTKKGKLIDILEKGSVIGEISVLTNVPRTATVTAESPVTVLRLTAVHMHQVIQDNLTLEDKLWEIAGPRFAENLIAENKLFSNLSDKDIKNWVTRGTLVKTEQSKDLDLTSKVGFLISGKAMNFKGKDISSPALIEKGIFTLDEQSKVWMCDLHES